MPIHSSLFLSFFLSVSLSHTFSLIDADVLSLLLLLLSFPLIQKCFFVAMGNPQNLLNLIVEKPSYYPRQDWMEHEARHQYWLPRMRVYPYPFDKHAEGAALPASPEKSHSPQRAESPGVAAAAAAAPYVSTCGMCTTPHRVVCL